MLKKLIRIATRQSPLAIWQAQYVKQRLQELHSGLEVELVPLVTKGDIWLNTPLTEIGGKGLFIKELEQAILDGRADIAVHSIKDIPAEFPAGLRLMAICQREDPRDALVSNRYHSLDELPIGSVVGTSSLRRQCQLVQRRSDLIIRPLRGNVGTRLAKLDNGEYDAIILAVAGLKRLQLEQRITCYLEPHIMLPASGQGAVGIECRDDDVRVRDWLVPLNHSITSLCVLAEREVSNRLQGGCQVPIGSYACIDRGELWLRALVGLPDGSRIIRGEWRGASEYARKIGIALAEELRQQGAQDILAQINK